MIHFKFQISNLGLRVKRSRRLQISLIVLLIFLPLALLGLWKGREKAIASWFDDNFAYRQTVAVTNSGSAQTDYQIPISLDTAALITAGKMRSDCYDIRVTNYGGDLLPLWIETGTNACNTATTKIWVKVPSVPTPNNVLLIYYGNSTMTTGTNGHGPSSADSGKSVFESFDTFDTLDTSKWTATGSPTTSGGAVALTNGQTLVTSSTVTSSSGLGRIIARVKQAATNLTGGKIGFSNSATSATNFHNDDAAAVILGSTEEQVSQTASTNLVSHHLLEETTTTDANQFKASGYLDTGKLSQAVSMYGNAAGTTGSTLTFNSGAQISGNNTEHFNTNQGSISFWVKPSWAGGDNLQHDFFDGNIHTAGGITDSFLIYKDTSNNLIFQVDAGNSRNVTSSISGWTSGSWHHIIATWQPLAATAMTLYVDGSSVGAPVSGPITITHNIKTNKYIGSSATGTQQSQALIDDFAIFDRVLTTTEITNIYNSGTGREAGYVADSSLKFYAKMDGSGTLSPVTYNGGATADQTAYNSSTNTNGNMMTDGNMETAGVGSWPVANGAVATKDTSIVQFDTQSLKVVSDGTQVHEVSRQAIQTVLSANTTYTVSGWFYNTGTVGFVDIKDETNATTYYRYDAVSQNTWEYFNGVFKTPASISASWMFNVRANAGTLTANTVYVDNLTLTPNLVDNGGMEGTYAACAAGTGTCAPGWNGQAGGTYGETATSHSGSKAATVSGVAKVLVQYYTSTATSGNYYLNEMWVRTASGTATFSSYNSSCTGSLGTETVTTTYQKFSYVCKATGTSIGVFIYPYSGEQIYIDDVSVIPLDNTALSFQSWTPASDAASADNDLSIHGDSDGVTSTTSGARGNAYTFDGATGYLRQKTYDVNIGTLTYADTNTDISDTGQEFEDWDNDDAGSAEYMVVVTNSDNTTSWGYFCANDGGTQTAVYTLKACTGGAEGFNGTSPSGKTPVGYEVRKSDFQVTGTSNFTVGAWIKPTSIGSGPYTILNNRVGANGYLLRLGSSDGVPTVYGYSGTASGNAVSAGAWSYVAATFNGSNVTVYVNGVAGTPSAITFLDGYSPFTVGVGDDNTQFFNGSIDSPFVISSALTASQIQDIYSSTAAHYGLVTNNSTTNTVNANSATPTNDTSYNTLTLIAQSSQISVSQGSTGFATNTTNLPNSGMYLRMQNADSTNALTVDWVAVAKQAGTAPTVAAPATEEKGGAPVAYWKFDDGTGTNAQDSSPNNNDGTITGATWQTSDQCISEKCLYFDGSNDVVTVANSVTGVQSVSFWVRPITTSEQFIDLNGSATLLASSGTITASGFTSPTIYVDGRVSSTIAANKWQHIMVTTASGLTGSAIKIGQISTNYGQAFLDDIKIYNYARTAAQIKTDFASRGSSKGVTLRTQGDTLSDTLSSGLVGYWKMDESSGNAADSSGNAYTLTNNATATFAAGKFGNAGSLASASSQYFNTATNMGNIQTTSFWVNPTSTTTYLVDLNGTQTITAAGTIAANSFTGSTIYVNGAITSTITANVWQHVVVTSTTAYAASAFAVGKVGANYLNGTIDDLRIYNRALSPREVRDLYNWAPGPVGYWNFEEGSGQSANDTSGNSNTGTLGASSSVSSDDPTWASGKYGKGLSFDGSNDYVDAGTGASLNVINNYTVESWIKYTSTQSDSRSAIVRHGNDLHWESLNTRILSLEAYYGSNWQYCNITDALAANTWYHTALTLSQEGGNTRAKIYVNSNLTKECLLTGLSTGSTASLTIGANSASDRRFNGSIDDVRIYNYARTQKQILADMSARTLSAVEGSGGSAVGYWKFDEGYGTTANDTSINANNLTLSSASWTNSGKFGKAWNGTNALWLSRADDSDFDVTATDDYGISLWFKSDSATNPSAAEYLVNKASSVIAGYAVYANTSGQICFGIDDDTTWNPDIASCSTADFYDAAWHHIAAIRDTVQDKTYLYIDGVLRDSDSDTTTATLANSLSLYVGDRDGTDNGDEFAGDIDELKIYRYALTQDEIKTDYNHGTALSLGSLSVDSSNVPLNSSSSSYCVPGDSSTCTAPVGEWNFEEGSGASAYDSSGNGNTGTATGTTIVSGKVGKARSFNGSSDYVNAGTGSTLDIANAVTMEAWVYLKSTSGGRYIGGKSTDEWILYFPTGSSIPQVYMEDVTATSLSAGSSINLYQWYHIAFTYDKDAGTNNRKIYINGSLSNQNTATGALGISVEPFLIGAFNTTPSNPFNGYIDGVKVYNYARSAAQVAWDYNRGGPVGHWKMDECQGGTANDSSGNGNTGTITIGATGTQTSVGNCSTSATTAWYSGRTGKFNSSLNFDGTDDYISVTDNSLFSFPNKSFTVEAWVNPSVSPDDYDAVVGKWNNQDSATKEWLFRFGVGDTIEFRLINSTTNVSLGRSTTTTISTGVWTHILGTYDGTTANPNGVKIYINGVRADTTDIGTSFGGMTDTTAKLFLGAVENTVSGNESLLNGKIDDVQIFNYALTATQIKTLYNENSAVRFGPQTGSP